MSSSRSIASLTVDELETAFRKETEPVRRVDIGARLATCFIRRDAHRLDVMLSELDEIVAELGREHELEEAIVTTVRAVCDLAASRFDASLTLVESALPTLQAHGFSYWLARARQCRGANLASRGEVAAGIEDFTAALAMAVEIEDDAVVVQTLTFRGNAFQDLGDLQRAIADYEQALEISRQSGNGSQRASLLNNLGNVHGRLGEHDAALRYYDECLEIVEREGGESALDFAARLHANRSIVLKNRGDMEGAISQSERALELSRRQSSDQNLTITLANHGNLMELVGRLDVAYRLYEESLAIARRNGVHVYEVMTLAYMASVDAARGSFDVAIALVEEALELAGETDGGTTEHLLTQRAAEVYERAGRFEAALRMQRRHFELERKINSDEARRTILSMESARTIEVAQKEAEIERLRNVELAAALEQLKSAQAQLVHAEKMASLGQLTAGIAHEINNPVNFIGASLSPLERDIDAILSGELDDEQRGEIRDEIAALLRGIREGAQRTAEIVRSLRTFSRLDEDELKRVDLAEGIASTLTLLRPRLDGITVVRDDDGPLAVECYPGQVNQVLMNLLANAIDACEGAGTITIATSSEAGSVRVAISDTGHGIAPDHLPRIFDPFFTTKPVGAGQGLGLAIAHSIVQKHGGTLTAESTPASGSTFVLMLPVTMRD
jgi:signal transduction histidine kinase